MVCRLTGAKPLFEPMLGNCCLDPQEQTYIFIQESAFENDVWEMAAILSRPQCVNSLRLSQAIWHVASVNMVMDYWIIGLLHQSIIYTNTDLL